MTETLRRDELIALLDRLGSVDDADALEAARQAHACVSAAGLSWEDVLVPQDSADEAAEERADADDEDADDEEADAAEDESPGAAADKNAASLALIGKLLARKDISEELRAELEGYKTDIAEGEFIEADRKYLRAVDKRLKT